MAPISFSGRQFDLPPFQPRLPVGVTGVNTVIRLPAR
jgi:hypothetical protein